MAESAYEAHLAPAARRFLNELPDDEKEEIWRLISLLGIDPIPDGRVKIVVDLPPVVVTVYRHPNWWIMYTIPESATVAKVAISRAWPRPRWAPLS